MRVNAHWRARRKSRRWLGSPPMRWTATRCPPIWPINAIITSTAGPRRKHAGSGHLLRRYLLLDRVTVRSGVPNARSVSYVEGRRRAATDPERKGPAEQRRPHLDSAVAEAKAAGRADGGRVAAVAGGFGGGSGAGDFTGLTA